MKREAPTKKNLRLILLLDNLLNRIRHLFVCSACRVVWLKRICGFLLAIIFLAVLARVMLDDLIVAARDCERWWDFNCIENGLREL